MNQLLEKKDYSLEFMDKRYCQRIETEINIRFFHGNLFYSGTISNLSERDMFINTKLRLPFRSLCIVLLRMDKQLFEVIVRVKRKVQNSLDRDGMGVELLNASPQYLNFVKNLIQTT